MGTEPEVAPVEPVAGEQQADTQKVEEGAEVVPESGAEDAAQPEREQSAKFIKRLKAENYALRNKARELHAQLNDYQQSAPAAPKDDAEPTLESVGYDVGQFVRAHSVWAANQAVKQMMAQDAQRRAQNAQMHTLQSYEQQIADFTETHPDFQDVVGSISAPIPYEVQMAIASHPRGAEIAYSLGANPDQAVLASMASSGNASALVQYLASRLPATPKAQGTQQSVPRVSSAPPPMQRVTSKSAAPYDPSKDSDADWWRRRVAKR